ncbi:hypothetical protein AALP_AA1G144500 [Arabis alpina]|uniref:Cytochrome p450 n=1 Tax=Arabis alpina TaxID=50452 RepID=A0A087HN76_ARAAL|nr:hypothetical protein AALP_AA1G144500 [Arabis alpina]
MVVISSKEAAEEALKTHNLECCSRAETVASRIFSYNFKDIGFAPYGGEWRVSRKLAVIELFTAKKLQSFRYIREEENDLFVKKMSQFASTKSPVNLTKTLFTLVASIVFRIGYGRNLHECKFIDEDSIEDLVHKFDLITETPSFSDFFPGGIGWLIDRISGQNKRLKKVFSELDTFYQNILDDHLKPERTVPENPDIVDVMIDMMKKQDKDGEDSFKLTTDHLKGIISTRSQVIIQGYDIPAKAQMMINVYSIARDPKLWTNPNEFNPDRFIDSSIDYRGLNYELLPFGSGRRICPGMPMGIANVELGLLNLLYYFDWALPEGKTVTDIDLEETGAITVCKKAILELVPILHH